MLKYCIPKKVLKMLWTRGWVSSFLCHTILLLAWFSTCNSKTYIKDLVRVLNFNKPFQCDIFSCIVLQISKSSRIRRLLHNSLNSEYACKGEQNLGFFDNAFVASQCSWDLWVASNNLQDLDYLKKTLKFF